MTRAVLFLSLCLSVASIAAAADVDMPRFLEALAHKETGLGWNGRPGPRGELSRYQITAAVWRQHSREPFQAGARDEAKARAVALEHLAWLGERIRAAGHAVTVERLATTWHYGHTYARRRTTWGEQVANLYSITP